MKRILLLCLSSSLLLGCSSGDEVAVKPRPVLTEVISLEKGSFGVELSGEIQARYASSLSFQVSGKISKRYVDVGARVRKGQLLVELDNRDYQLQLDQTQAKYNVANANVQRAKADLTRFETLMAENVVSNSQFESQLNMTRVAEAQLNEAQSAVDIAQNRMQYTRLYANEQGVITQLLVEEGQVVAAGQGVLDLARPSQKDVVIQVPEGQLQQIKVNDKVFVEVWALNNKIYSGHIREISPKADKITRTYITKVTLDNADENIELGMSARIRTEKVDKDVSVKLPLTAIYPLDNKTYVWVVAADMRVQLKEVEVVNDNIQDKITIHSGLENGEIVVVAGIHRLHAGQTVRLLD